MQQSTFLKLDGIAGTSQVPGHAGEIRIFDVKLINGSKPSEPKLALKFIKAVDSVTPALENITRDGRVIKKAVLIFEQTDRGRTIRSHRVEMENVRIQSFAHSSLEVIFRSEESYRPSMLGVGINGVVDVVVFDVGKINDAQVLATIGREFLSRIGF